MSGAIRKRLARLALPRRRKTAPLPPVRPPRELAGQWVAWSPDGRRIVASGESLADVRERTRGQGVSYERLPRLERHPAEVG